MERYEGLLSVAPTGRRASGGSGMLGPGKSPRWIRRELRLAVFLTTMLIFNLNFLSVSAQDRTSSDPSASTETTHMTRQPGEVTEDPGVLVQSTTSSEAAEKTDPDDEMSGVGRFTTDSEAESHGDTETTLTPQQTPIPSGVDGRTIDTTATPLGGGNKTVTMETPVSSESETPAVTISKGVGGVTQGMAPDNGSVVTSSASGETTTPVAGASTDGENVTATETIAMTTTPVDAVTMAPDPCTMAPCQNDGTCATLAAGAYNCSCVEGWTGDNCSEAVDECASQPCINGGTCEDALNNYTCICPQGYTGAVCQTEVNECSEMPCLNGGTCRDLVNDFSCTCLPGFNGTTCEQNVDECLSSPCGNQAVCVDQDNGFLCNCTSHWTGVFCTQDVDECLSEGVNQCHEMAECENSVGNYTCTCQPGYTGDGFHCQFIDLCANNPCSNGFCHRTLHDSECKCWPGWTGANCSQDIDECEDGTADLCGSGESTGEGLRKECVNHPGGFSCVCPPDTHTNLQGECLRDVLYPHGNTSGYQSDDDLYGPFNIPGGMPFYGKQYYTIYTSMNGYVLFEKQTLTPHPPGGTATQFPASIAVIAPLWADIDTSAGKGALYIDTFTPQSGNQSVFEEIKRNAKEHLGRSDVDFKVAMVITWKEVALYPAFIYSGVQNATFQLVLVTSNEESFAMFNYNPDGDWWNFDDDIDVRTVLIGLTDGGSNSIQLASIGHYPVNESNTGLRGRYLFALGPKVENPKAGCLTWYSSQDAETMDTMLVDSEPCPCTWDQAARDTRFVTNATTWCAETRLSKTMVNQRCCYDNTRALLTGYPLGGHIILEGDTAEVKDACCKYLIALCDLYYQVRPSDNCSRYTPPVWGSMWGVGHVETLTGTTSTLNRLRELLLLHLPDSQFVLQGRMGLPQTADGNTRNATGLVAIAAKSDSSSRVEVRLTADRDDLSIYLDGVDLGTMATMAVGASQSYAGVDIDRLDNETILVQFVDGVGLKVKPTFGFMDLLVTMAAELAAETGIVGVLGRGKTGDALDGSYQLEQNDSLFTYGSDGKTFTDFQKTDYVPEDFTSVIQDLIGQKQNESEAVRSCDGIQECLYDYLASGEDINKGVAAITADVRRKADRRKIENFPPKFTDEVPRFLVVTMGKEIRVPLSAVDPEGDKVTFNISTSLPATEYKLENGIFTWTPPFSFQYGNMSVFLKFTSSDVEGATAVLRPEIHLCTCAMDDECYFGYRDIPGMESNPDRYYESVCQCRPGYTGRLCVDWAALCQENPCYANHVSTGNCTSTPGSAPWGVNCTPCPEGLIGDGVKCYDDNECVTGANECSHICVNQPGGYVCSCEDGFTLSPDDSTCKDTDECTRGLHECDQVGQYCQNTLGSYGCLCTARYFMDQGQCYEAGKRFGGRLTSKSVSLGTGAYTGCDRSIQDSDSALFKQVAKTVKKQVDTIFRVLAGFMSSAVTRGSCEEGSIVAYFDLYFNASSPVNGSAVAAMFKSALRRTGCMSSGPDCALGDLMTVNMEYSYAYAKDLCESEMDNDCHMMSTNCSSFSNGTFSCRCKTGYSAWLNSDTICQDIDECRFGSHTCDPVTSQCVNTPGSHSCECLQGFTKLGDTCTAVCQPNPCENKGKCMPDSEAGDGYKCRCRGMWIGAKCEAPNKEANRLQNILIGVGVALGVLCLILLILLIVCCLRIKCGGSEDELPKTKPDDSFDAESKISHSVWVDRLFSSALSLHDDDTDIVDDRAISRMNTFGKKNPRLAMHESKS